MTRFGPDLSNYQSDGEGHPPFSLEDAQKLVAKQCSFVVIGRQARNQWARQQADFCLQAGIQHIAEYLESINGRWPDLFPETKYVAIAVEVGSEFVDEASIDAGVEWVRQQGRTPVIYSSAYMWNLLGLGGLTKYHDLPLWDAYYDGQANGFALPTPFGGWTECVIDQYTADWNDGGLAYPLDMNECVDTLFVDAAPIPVPAPEQPRRLNVASDADVQAWIAVLSNPDFYAPDHFEVINGTRYAVYDRVKVRLP